MILNLLVVAILIASVLMWAIRGRGRGLFSALLSCLCVVISGAVAFALWEPLTYGVFLDLNESVAFGLGLIVPFAGTLLITRLATEALVPKNIDLGDVENFVGGAVFGAISGVITVGILVLSIGMFRMGPSLMGYEAVMTRKGGSLVKDKSLWVPVDELTVKFYEHLSQGAFSTPTPLAERYPRLYEQAAMQRMVYTQDGGKLLARNTIKGEDFEIRGRYSISGSVSDLTSYETIDANNQAKVLTQEVYTPEGDAITGAARVEGFLIEFRAGAGEKSGQFVVGPGQVRLMGVAGGEPFAVQPFSIVGQPEASAGSMVRFPINAGDLFIPSVGGGSTSFFAFEFLVPDGAEVQSLVVKNFRVPVSSQTPPQPYASAKARDAAITSGNLFETFGLEIGGARIKDIDTSESIAINPEKPGSYRELTNSALIPQGLVIATTTGTKGIEVGTVASGRAEEQVIVNGRAQFARDELKQKGLDRKLRVDRFATKRDTTILQVMVKVDGTSSRLGQALETSTADGPPRIVDSEGRAYDAVGWVYGDGGTYDIRFTPGQPIASLSELPSALSSTKRDQTLHLIFQPTSEVTIESFIVGKKQIATFANGGLKLR